MLRIFVTADVDTEESLRLIVTPESNESVESVCSELWLVASGDNVGLRVESAKVSLVVTVIDEVL